MRRPSPAAALATLLAGSGVLHLVAPQVFDGMVPRALPGAARTWTVGSGVAELGVAGLVAHPRTRRFGGLAAAGLFVGVFPANVSMAVDVVQDRRRPTWYRAAVLARLPLQVPLVGWSLRVRRDAR